MHKKKAQPKTPPTQMNNEEQLRFMAESMPQKILTLDPDGTVIYLNPQWTEYSGAPLEEILGWGWKKLLHPDETEDILDRWQFSAQTGEPLSIEHRLKKHDGSYRWHLTRARAMRDDTGQILKWFGSCTDIHDTKLSIQREHELTIKALTLTKQREELIALNASKDEFISLASHQLRTPATIVKQYLNMIIDGHVGELNPELEDMLRRANASNERELDIVDDLLRVARLDAGKVRLSKIKTNIVPIVQEVINEHFSVLELRQQTATVYYSQPGISATVDTARIKMVLENLIDNASKYSPPGKTIEVSIDQTPTQAVIAVTDHGVGIRSEDIPKLFQKFSRLNNPLSVEVGGTGLGLYWAKRIISLHHGTITVTSSPGENSTFTISIPLDDHTQ